MNMPPKRKILKFEKLININVKIIFEVFFTLTEPLFCLFIFFPYLVIMSNEMNLFSEF